MNDKSELVIFSDDEIISDDVTAMAKHIGARIIYNKQEIKNGDLVLRSGKDGLTLESEGQVMHCDFTKMLRRLKQGSLSQELLVKAVKIKSIGQGLKVIDATAGLGEDALLLAAAGFCVKLYERNSVIAVLLKDALRRAEKEPELLEAVMRMQLFQADSIIELPHLTEKPDVVYLDPMFPAKTKSSLCKKKFQLLHHLETPCMDENELLEAAIAAKPRKIVIKRPLKGGLLGNHKPDYSLKGKAIRYDCILL